MTQATLAAEFECYLGTLVALECNLLSRWREHADAYPHCSVIAAVFSRHPSSLAASESLFMANDRLINKCLSHLLSERVRSLVFLSK